MKKVFCLSMSHKEHSLDERCKFALDTPQVESWLKGLREIPDIREVVLLSTCNRFELIAICGDVETLYMWITLKTHLNRSEIDKYFKIYSGLIALRHIMRVISGVDSKLYGEKNIAGQVKVALESSKKHKLIGSVFEFIYSHAFRVSKKIQNTIQVPKNSVSQMFLKAINKHYGKPEALNFLIIGSGQLGKQALQAILALNPNKVFVISRKPQYVSEEIRQKVHKVGGIDDIHPFFSDIDVCFTATNSQEPVLTSQHLSHFHEEKKRLMVDASLPPTVHQKVKAYDHIHYYDIDELTSFSQSNELSKMTDLTEKVNIYIESEVMKLQKELDANFLSNVIQEERCHLQEYLEHVSDWAIQSSTEQTLPKTALFKFSKELSGMLLHMTTIFLKKCCYEHDLEMINEIKGLIDKHDSHVVRCMGNDASLCKKVKAK